MKRIFLMVMIPLVLGVTFVSQSRADEKKSPKWYRFWGNDDKDEKKYYDRSFHNSQRISAAKAGRIVLSSFPGWRLGKGWKEIDEDELEIYIPLEYQGKIIGEIKVHPVTAQILSEESESSSSVSRISIAEAGEVVRQALSEITISKKIRLGKHGNYWEVPLLYQSREVEEIKVGTGTGNILPDWHLEEAAHKHRNH